MFFVCYAKSAIKHFALSFISLRIKLAYIFALTLDLIFINVLLRQFIKTYIN